MKKLILFLCLLGAACGQNVGIGPGVYSLTPGSGGSGGGGNVSSSGSPTGGQLAQWVDSTHITGVATQASSVWIGYVSDPTGTGLWVFNNNPTLLIPILSGIWTAPGARVITAAAMGADVIDVTMTANTKTYSTDKTFTVSGSPATDQYFGAWLTNSDTVLHTNSLTGSTPATWTIAAGATVYYQWRTTGANAYTMIGGPPSVIDLTANTTPASTDLIVTTSATTAVGKKSTLAQTSDATLGGLSSNGVVTRTGTNTYAIAGTTGTLGSAVYSVSPALTGSPTAPTQAASDNSTKISTTAYVAQAGLLLINAQTGTTYTLLAADLTSVNNGGSVLVTMNNASSNTLTIPLNSGVAFPVGTQVVVEQLGAGATTIAATGGVTINSQNGLVLGAQYSTVCLVKTATDTWQLSSGPNVSVASGKTATISNSITFAGTDGTTQTFPTTSATLARTDAANTFTGASTGTSWVLTTPTVVAPNSGLNNRFRSSSSVTAQAPAASTRTYVTGSDIGPFTAAQIAVGTMIFWELDITKTAAGVATSTFDIAFGTAGSTADTARVSFTKPAGVGNVDHCLVKIGAVVKTNSASGVVIGDFTLLDDQTGAGGFLASGKYISSLTTTSSTFDTTTATHVGLCITTGASDAYTINSCKVWSLNL